MKFWLTTLIILFSTVGIIKAESLSVSLRVGDTRVQFTGYTSPGAFITIKQNAAVISTTVAGSNGDFDQTIDAYNPGIQTFEISATDSLGYSTPTLTYNINALPNTLTTIGNIFFPPTIILTPLTGTISGLSHPLSVLTLVLSTGVTHPVVVATDGSWSFDLSILPQGDYTAFVIAIMPGNILSLESTALSFTIAGISSSTESASATGTPSPTPTSANQSMTEPSRSPRLLIVAGTPIPTTNQTSSPLSTLVVTLAKPISLIYIATPFALIVLMIKLIFFKMKKK